MENTEDKLETMSIHRMKVSFPVMQAFSEWREKVRRPTAVIFEQLMRHAMKTGFKPSERDTRNDPIK